jgi:enoyl-CoA hydratase/3-hydroxyacyl-CoA dehydrogenase
LKVAEVRTVAVLGAGVMGHGIAEVAALAGFDVNLYDIKDEFVKSGIEKINWSLSKFVEKKVITQEKAGEVSSRIKGGTDLKKAVGNADVVIEAAPEDIRIKSDLFRKVSTYAPERSLLASNTSTLPISEIASASTVPERFLGIHFFNPPPLMPLVEVIRGERTDEGSLALGVELGKKFGKEVVICRKDVPGFIVNRVLGPLLNEAAWLVSRKEATIEQVDSAVTYKVGLPMGLFELADYSGIDTLYKASEAVRQRDASNVLVAPLLREKFEKGKFGRKSGEGFYKYGAGKWERPAIHRESGQGFDPVQVFAPAVNAAAWLLRNSVCDRDDLDKSVKLGLGFPDGILQMADQWGIDYIVEVLRQKERRYGSLYTPDPLLESMAREGRTGSKAGRGFYDYASTETKLEEAVLTKKPPIAWIRLSRPHRLNTITPRMIEELASLLRMVASDNSVRVVVIAGEGAVAFSAGADLSSFEFTSPGKTFDSSRRWFEVFSMLERLPKPVIAAIRGYAFGGGCELALACDFRLASENSQIGLTETDLGLIPGAGGTQRLVRVVGLPRAKEMIFFGERLSAEEAHKAGLVDRVFKNEEFDGGVLDFANKLAKRAPLALKYAKYAVNLASQVPTDIGQLFEAGGFGLLLSSQDVSEGVSAFLSKREPEFKGE